ncbi:MAG TPA: response regulator transcription factor [Bryobacteraceae bacterium]|jgi:two-component system, NarL family, response regulator NreC|nr:response regulator transcription factor [Bryobacteraceae bacterium]
MPRKLRIVLADDHAVVRKGFRLILNQEPDIEVIAEAGNGSEAIKLALELRPDVLIMDIAMPEMTGVEATRRIHENFPDCRILILSMHKDPVYVRESLRAGARGYLLKESIDEDLLRAVRALAGGDGFLSPEVSRTVLDDYQQTTDPFDSLTAREREVLQLLADGKVAKEVATALDVSVYTVDAHRGRIMKKLGLRSSTELVKFAMRKGLIQ